MSHPIIQKIYDLRQEELSFLICECVFGEIKRFNPSQNMMEGYKTEIVPKAKIIVNTYDTNQNKVGKALVVKTQYEVLDDFLSTDSITSITTCINLIILTDQGYYVDLKEFSLDSAFSPQRGGLKIYYWGNKAHLQLFSENYGNIGFEPGFGRKEGFNLNFNLGKAVSGWTRGGESLTQIYSGKAPPISLGYVKSDQPNTHNAALMIETLSKATPLSDRPGINMNFTNLTITFIPLKKAEALLAGK